MRRARSRALAATTAVLVTLLAAGCSPADQAPGSSAAPGGTSSGLSGELTIFAAASLTASFDELAAEFGEENPGVMVKPIDFDGSSTLVTQLEEGASADVFASADEANMQKLADAGLLAGDSSIFASNTLEIAVAPGNPKGIDSLSDLADPGLLVVLCAPQVPCGAASQKLLSLDGVTVTPASEEQNVTAVLTKVKTGEADAGLVYKTDVLAAGSSVSGVDAENADQVVNDYTIGVPKSAKDPALATAFIQWVLSDRGQAVLDRYGFTRP